jgi:hypothetical protein
MIRQLEPANATARLEGLTLLLRDAARASGRTLLLLDVRTDDPAARPHRSLGFAPFGRVPGCARTPDGGLADNSFYDLDPHPAALGRPSSRHNKCVGHHLAVIASPRRGRGDPVLLDCFAPAGRSQ